ncbi:ABC transporter permease [Thalassomonas viridans]|uniref:ABC transporter permease n=1 Tax=Thalassomonas viridans TaxID=137584 RepID=A0AAF0C823_9GAMM|nr:ABC transporter permease [Thalassomonas viridans]WDE03765.1 ABC transporter permease [Thalassomonas viridans]
MSLSLYRPKQAWASLRKKPGFVSTVVTTMGITLGALLCILTLAYVLIVKPLPYPEQEHLYRVESGFLDAGQKPVGRAFTYPGLIHLYQNQSAFEQSALLSYGNDVLTSLPERPSMNTLFVTPEWFPLLGAKMALGRSFEQTEALETHHPVAILSFDTWQREYGGRADILSQKVSFSGTSFNIVGVLSEDFIEPQLYETGLSSQVLMPWDFNESSEWQRRAWGNISDSQLFIGKLAPTISAGQAQQMITPLMNDTWQENVAGSDFFAGWSLRTEVNSLQAVLLGDNRETVYMLLAGVIGLVLIACANIANLFMSRTAEQQRQLAIHAAVGASKKQLFKTLFAESGLLMAQASLLALAIALGGFEIMQHFLAQQLPRVDELNINGFTLFCALTIALLLAYLFARLSANMINYRVLNATLQSSGKGTGIQVSQKVRQLLITSQVAIVTALVFVNISLFKDAVATIDKPVGFETDNIATLVLAGATATQPSEEERKAIMQELTAEFSRLPQIQAVSQSPSPLNGFGILAQVVTATNERLVVQTKHVDETYFELINQSLLEGRTFTDAEIRDEVDLLVVNEVYARHLAGDKSPLGMQITFSEEPATIVGVVKGMTIPGRSEVPMRAYRTNSRASMRLMFKLKPGQEISRRQAVEVIAGVTGQYNLFELAPLNDRRDQLLFTQYTTAVTSAVLALLTFFLAAIGLYGILSYGTQMRRFEIGTRLAIGAKRRDLIAMVIKDNSPALATGIITGMILLLALYLGFPEEIEGYIRIQLIPVFALTLGLIATISWFACYWPLRQFINRPAVYSLRGSD